MTDIIEDAGAYEQWDPKHPNFVKNYKKITITNSLSKRCGDPSRNHT